MFRPWILVLASLALLPVAANARKAGGVASATGRSPTSMKDIKDAKSTEGSGL